MKFILMLLVLFVLTDPVLAQPLNNTAECQTMHRGLTNAYDSGKPVSEKQIVQFFSRCVQNDITRSDEAFHRKLVQNAKHIKTVTIASM
jgi:hypothetical protein